MTSSLRAKTVLLTGQTFSLGMLLALILISANAVFLPEYGSDGLPYTYIAMAVVGMPLSVALASSMRRFPIVTVGCTVLAGGAALIAASWIALRNDVLWVSGVLLVLFVVMIQIGFVFVGGQAGRVLHVREIKEHFPRIVSGFAAGFLLGGLVAPLLFDLFGRPEDLLLGATLATALFLGLMWETGRRFPAELATVDQVIATERAPLRSILSKPFVMAVLAYQVMSAVGTQLIDFMTFDRAAARYTNSEALTHVVGTYTVALNAIDLLFLAFVAGRILRSFGLRVGIPSNPAVILVFSVVILAIGITGADTSLLLFAVVAGARIADVTLSDGMTRTSINAAYQVMPDADRLAVQATVEGLGVPLAIGLTGVVLLLVDAGGLGFTFVAAMTLGVCVVWTATGIAVYRGYGERLVATLRQRVIDPTALRPEEISLTAIDGLLASASEVDVRLGIDALAGAEHPQLLNRLQILTDDVRPGVRAAAITLLGRQGEGSHLDRLAAAIDDGDGEVVVAALSALRDRGDSAHAEHAARRIRSLAQSPDAADRRAAALALAVTLTTARLDASTVGPSSGAPSIEIDDDERRELLVALMGDADANVRSAALTTAGASGHAELHQAVLDSLADTASAPAAVAAVAGFGSAIVEPLARALGPGIRAHDFDAAVAKAHTSGADASGARVVRLICGAAAVPEAWDVLAAHCDHRQRDVRLAVLLALGQQRRADTGLDVPTAILTRALDDATTHAARCLEALHTLSGLGDEADHLRRAIADELELARRLVAAALVLRYDAEAMRRSIDDLGRTGSVQAMALEMLEVTLSADDRGRALPLLRPGLLDAERRALMVERHLVASYASVEVLLGELITDPHELWRRAWLRTCALHLSGVTRQSGLTRAVAASLDAADADESATARWALARL